MNERKEGPAIRLERTDDRIGHVIFDSPGESVNTLSGSFADEFVAVFEEIESDESLLAVVLRSGKSDSFIAGADLKMLEAVEDAEGAAELSRLGQQAVERISSCRVPVVVAIHGPCLGGGLELALAAQGRVASSAPATKLGLPEVQLGILPGMGGTQRLPRLVGLSTALDLLLTGKQIDARRARKHGLVDEVVPRSVLVTVAEQRATQLAMDQERSKASFSALREHLDPADLRELALAENPLGRKVVFDQAKKRVLEKTHGNYPAPPKILEVVRGGLERGETEGFRLESQAFGELVVSPEARALRHIFFSQQELKKDTGIETKVEPRPVRQVGVLGGGLMGAGIAYVSATAASCFVRLKEIAPEGISTALQQVDKLLTQRVEKKRLTLREKDQVLARITRTLDYSGFRGLDVVVEAVFEDLSLKQRVLAEVEENGSETTIFASNTSSLPISEIAKGSRHPGRVIGMHYFSPVHKMPLLEVITTDSTEDWVTRTCVLLGKKQGKTVIVVRDGPGFYTTRILGPYLNEAAYLLLEGWSVTTIDRALVRAGFPVGPLALLDEVGIDVGSKVAATLEGAFGERLAPPRQLGALSDAGRQGRKNNRGFYDYAHRGKGKRPVDVSVYDDLGLDVPGDESSEDESQLSLIEERCLLAMVNEAHHCLGEGILRSTRDGDIGAIFGLGFPPHWGGPFFYVEQQGVGNVVARLKELEATHGARFTPAPTLKQRASSERT